MKIFFIAFSFRKQKKTKMKISNIKIPKGKIIIMRRKNIGMSYGSYSDAFKKFRKKYSGKSTFFEFFQKKVKNREKEFRKIDFF